MKSNNILKNVIPNSLSLNYSNINLNEQNPLQYRKIKSPPVNSPRNQIYQHVSIDSNDFHHQKLIANRKIAKSSYMKQRLNNYSYLMNNLYKNLYNDFNFQKAPSFNQNRSEIHQIINGKKQKEIQYLDNLFFNSKFPNDYLNDLYAIRKKNILFQHDRNTAKILHRYNSSGQLKSLQRNYLIKLTKQDESKDNNSPPNNSNILKTRNKNNLHINPLKNVKNNISTISTTTNKSINTNKVPEIYSNSNVSINEENENRNILHLPTFSLPKITQGQYNISSINSKNSDEEIFDNFFNNNSFITNLGVGKMKSKLNELMFENGKKFKKINEFEKKILKFKIIQIYQKESLEKVLNDNRFNIQDRLDHIIKMYKLYENIYEEYQMDLNRYINYVYLMISNNEMQLENDIKKKRELDYEVEVLVDKLLAKQKRLEYLVNLRNFLFHVKNKEKNLIKMDNEYVLRISKRKQFIDRLFDIFGYEPNTMATKYLKRLIDIEELESILMKKKMKTRPNTRKSTNKSLKFTTEDDEDALAPPTPGEIIFDDIDDFMKIIEILEDRNICLLKEKEIVRISCLKLKRELNNYITIEKEDYDNVKVNNYIKDRIKKLKELKEKNEQLKKRRELFIKLYKVNDSRERSKEKLKIVSHNLFNNLNYFYFVNYSKLIQSYKYPFLLFLERLIDIMNTTLSSNDFKIVFKMEDCYKYIPLEKLKEILMIKKEFFNDKNQHLIMNYALQLIKLYEYIGDYFMRKNQFYKSNNEEQYKKNHELVQNERKIYNARIIKKLIYEKRQEKSKKLIEKWEKKTIKDSRKLDLDIKPFYLMKSLSQKNMKEKATKNTNIFSYKFINEF